MSKKKRIEAMLTPKEKLELALVQEEEQPYHIPENWCWVKLGGITKVIGGGTPSTKNPDYYDGGTIPWICPSDLTNYNDIYISNGARNITELGLENSSAQLVPKDTVCLSTRAPIGYVAIAANALSTNQGFRSFIPSSFILSKYLFWYLKGNKESLEKLASGTTFLELSTNKVATMAFPLAPKAEQQRIVDRIESLLAKLEETKEKAQAVIDGYENRRDAILHKAFTGELIKQKNMKDRDEEKKNTIVFLKEVVNSFQYGISEKSDYSYTGMPILRIPNIAEDGIDFTDLKYVSGNDVDATNQVLEKDILIIRSNGSRNLVGKCALVPRVDQKYTYASYLIRIRPSERVRPDYLVLYLNSKEAKDQIFAKAKSSAGIFNLNAKELGSIALILPDLKEQEKIVSKTEKLLSAEVESKRLAEEAISKIMEMRRMILSLAFRGKLGTNNPHDEKAIG